jgi:hypothetical protein
MYLLSAAVYAAIEEDVNPFVWKPKTTSVTVFKNGLGFFMREGNTRLYNGWCFGTQIPPATFGTLAIFSHNTNELVDIVGAGKSQVIAFDGIDAPDTHEARISILKAYTNLNVSITYKTQKTQRIATGSLDSVNDSYVIIDASGTLTAVPLDDITQAELLGLPLRVHVAHDNGSTPASSHIGMAYLRKGIAWLPEYTLSIRDETNAVLSLKGTLINEADDLIRCNVNFVVGVPHFVHSDYLSPVAIGQAIRTIAASVAPRQIMSQVSNRAALFSNNDVSFQPTSQVNIVERAVSDTGGNIQSTLGNLPQMAGPGSSDYTVYTQKDLTVRQGEKAIVSLFRHQVRYSHIYRWNTSNKMKHYFVLHNTTPTAWTTGPCLGIDGERPLTEDTLYYTPSGGRAELEVSTAINIGHTKSEKEIERKLKAHEPSHNCFFDLVTVGGTIQLRNYEKKPCTIVITAPVPGNPITASDDGALSLDTKELRLKERKGTIEWNITLDPDEAKTITYRYERYVPSN